jgi:polyhydroxyalkanoate synthase subunit PhaC
LLPKTGVHALGYCLGGTLLAAQTDFSDPGELSLFIDEGQVEMFDSLMWRQGVLRARQMKGTFQMLRSRDLIWSYRVIH